MSKVWLVYRPAHDYEDSEEPYFVCPTEALANACATRMNVYANALHKRLPYLPNVPSTELPDDAPEWIAFNAVYDKFEAIKNRARWPYGIDLFNCRQSGAIVAVKPLEVRSKT